MYHLYQINLNVKKKNVKFTVLMKELKFSCNFHIAKHKRNTPLHNEGSFKNSTEIKIQNI